MDSCFGELETLLREAGAVGGQAAPGGRLRLPSDLGSGSSVKWDTRGQTGLPSSIGPPPTSAIVSILSSLSNDLHKALGIKQLHGHVAGLFGAVQQNKLGRTVVINGASHAKWLDNALNESGEKTIFIEAPSFRFRCRRMWRPCVMLYRRP
jgi:hypothetical protein